MDDFRKHMARDKLKETKQLRHKHMTRKADTNRRAMVLMTMPRTC
jgi:hypothetical protein